MPAPAEAVVVLSSGQLNVDLAAVSVNHTPGQSGMVVDSEGVVWWYSGWCCSLISNRRR